MMRMLPVFRSAKKIRPSEANAGAVGHARPVCTGPSWTAGLFGVPPPGRWTQYQAYARPAKVAIAAMTTVTSIKRVRGCMKPEHHSLVKASCREVAHSASATRRIGDPDVPCRFRGNARSQKAEDPRAERFATFSITGTLAPRSA